VEDETEGNPEEVEGNLDEDSPGGSLEGNEQDGSQDLQSRLDALEERRRHFQGLADKEKRQRLALEEQVANSLTPEDVQRIIDEKMAGLRPASPEEIATQIAAMQSATEQKRKIAEEYGVDASKLTGKTPEDMATEAQGMKEARDAEKTALRTEIETQLRAELAEKHGLDDSNFDAADHNDAGAPSSDKVTVTDFAKMDAEQVEALSDTELDRLMGELHSQVDENTVFRAG